MLDRDPHFERHEARVVVVTGNQAPELVAHDQRHRHRRMRTHVAHVLEMDRREAAQRGIREVGRAAGCRVHGRNEPRGFCVHVCDEPYALFHI